VIASLYEEIKDSDVSNASFRDEGRNGIQPVFLKTLPHPTAAMPRLEITGHLSSDPSKNP